MAEEAPKKTTKKAAAKKTATKKTTTKKTAKTATKKAVAKKTATKKAAKKVTAVEQELNLDTKTAPTLEEIQQAAYFNYIERLNNGEEGTPEQDWAKAIQQLS